MKIKGTVFPIGKINKNRWGIPDEPNVVNSAITSLKQSKLKICPSCSDKNEHYCDFIDSGIVVGEIEDVARVGDNIEAVVNITHEEAIKNFKTGVWGTTWSPFGTYETMDDEGFIHGKYENKYLTFVNQPAWDESKTNEVYASEDKHVKSYCELSGDDELSSEPSISGKNLEDENNILFASSFDSSSLEKNNFDSFGENIMTDEEVVLENNNDIISDLKETEEQSNTELNEVVKQLTKKITELESKIVTTVDKKDGSNDDVDNKLDKYNGVPEDTVKMLIENAIVNERESVKKSYAIDNYKNVCKTIGIEVKESELNRFNDERFKFEDIEREINLIKSVAKKTGIKLDLNKEPKYPSSKENKTEESKSGYTVGRYNHRTKQYEI